MEPLFRVAAVILFQVLLQTVQLGMGYEVLRHYFHSLPDLTWFQVWAVVIPLRAATFQLPETREAKASIVEDGLITSLAGALVTWIVWLIVT
jgi:hypothetical protein